MRRVLCLLLLAGLVVPAGFARGSSGTFAVVPGTVSLPAPDSPNGGDLGLAPAWLTPPAAPVMRTRICLLSDRPRMRARRSASVRAIYGPCQCQTAQVSLVAGKQ